MCKKDGGGGGLVSRMGGGRVATFSLASRQHGVDLVHEDDRGLQGGGHREQGSHHLLALADPLGGEGAGADVEEGGLDVAGDGPPNQGLPCARGAKEEEPLGWRSGTLQSEVQFLGQS